MSVFLWQKSECGLGHVRLVRIGIGIQISDPSDPSDSTEHFILDLDCCHVENGAHKAPKRVNVVLIACVVQKVNKLYLHLRVRTTMCTKMIFTRHIRTKVTFGSGQPCSPRWVDRIQIRRIRVRIRPIERVRIQWIRWIGIPILPIEHALILQCCLHYYLFSIPLPHCKVLLSSLLLEMSFSHSLPVLPCADKLEEEYIQRFLGELTPYQESNLIQLKQKLSTLLKDKVCFSYSGYCVRRVAPPFEAIRQEGGQEEGGGGGGCPREHFEISVQNPSFWALLALCL